MPFQQILRGFRAPTAILACAAVALVPAASAEAKAAKKKAAKKQPIALKEAHGKRPATGAVKAVGRTQSTKALSRVPAAANTGLGTNIGLSPAMQLAAMTTAIKAAPGFYAGRSTGCSIVTPLLASQPGQIMAGNFRDEGGACYVWLNLQQSELLTGEEICKTALHEMGHLSGLQHSTNPLDVMFAPFVSDPIPAPCVSRG
jgi:hypothetical protein